MSISKTANESVVIWQTNSDSGVGEPALLVGFYMDCLQIEQDENTININYETVNELCKVLKEKDFRPK